MKSLLAIALLTISTAQADCGGYDCLDVMNLTYEEYIEKHGRPEPQEEWDGFSDREIQIMKYQLMGLSDEEIERQLLIDNYGDTK
jgi:DNA-binding NarL/FixJ family response regulator